MRLQLVRFDDRAPDGGGGGRGVAVEARADLLRHHEPFFAIVLHAERRAATRTQARVGRLRPSPRCRADSGCARAR